ncbi:MAG: DUF1445 domain-containing protein [Burkholderiaceae bacterium]
MPIAAPSRAELAAAAPRTIREHIRAGRWRGHTKGLAVGFHQANLIVVPHANAFDFMRFCQRNAAAFPLIHVTDPGDPSLDAVAEGGDVRTDIGCYDVYENGEFSGSVTHLNDLWRADHVAFLTGCAISLERPLREAGILLPQAAGDEGPSPMFMTRIACKPAGVFAGPLVVGLRIVPDRYVVPMTAVTARHPDCHGAPVHIGDPAGIIDRFDTPDWGTPRSVPAGHTAMFWACGMTAQAAAMKARLPELITQSVGHMLVTDLPVTVGR